MALLGITSLSLGRWISLNYSETKTAGLRAGGIPPNAGNRQLWLDDTPTAGLYLRDRFIEISDRHSKLSRWHSASNGRVFNRSDPAVDSRVALRTSLDPVVLVGHRESLELPIEDRLEELSCLTDIVDCKVEVRGFHVCALMLSRQMS